MEHFSLGLILLFLTVFLGKKLARLDARMVSDLVGLPGIILCLIIFGLSIHHFVRFIEITFSYESNQLLAMIFLIFSFVLIKLYADQVEKEKKYTKKRKKSKTNNIQAEG